MRLQVFAFLHEAVAKHMTERGSIGLTSTLDRLRVQGDAVFPLSLCDVWLICREYLSDDTRDGGGRRSIRSQHASSSCGFGRCTRHQYHSRVELDDCNCLVRLRMLGNWW